MPMESLNWKIAETSLDIISRDVRSPKFDSPPASRNHGATGLEVYQRPHITRAHLLTRFPEFAGASEDSTGL